MQSVEYKKSPIFRNVHAATNNGNKKNLDIKFSAHGVNMG